MASMKPNLLSAISGCMPGVEFAVARTGQVLRRRKPSKPFDSPAQIESQTVRALRIADWHNMTPEAMREWTSYAATHPVKNRLGETIYLTGFNWFMKLLDTDDGILLPEGTMPPPQLGAPRVFEGGPYEFNITWQPEAEDDWNVTYWIGTCSKYWSHLSDTGWIPAGTYAKLGYPADFYSIVTARGITFLPGKTYILKAQLTAPRMWPSICLCSTFELLEPGLFWYKMNDNGPSSTVYDAQLEYNQTFLDPTGNPSTSAHSVAGVHGRALHFDGIDDTIRLTAVSHVPYMALNQDFTLCFWWKPDAPVGASFKTMLGGIAGVHPGIQFRIRNVQSSCKLNFLYGGGNNPVVMYWDETDVSIWQHWAVARGGTHCAAYRNGVLKWEATGDVYSGVLAETAYRFAVASNWNHEEFAAGAMDDLRLYDSELTAAEILELATP